MARILATGSMALDTTRTPFKTATRVLGGAATFFAVSGAHFTGVSLLSIVGKDFPGKYLEMLGGRGIDLRGVQHGKGKSMFFDSTFSFDMYSRTANATELGVFKEFKPKVPSEYADIPYVYLGTMPPERQLEVLEQCTNRKFALMDTIEFYIKNFKPRVWKTIAEVDGMVLNDIEARMLCRQTSLFKCARQIMKSGPKLVVIKKGENGSILFYEDTVFPLAAYPLENVVDPTGAGDAFAGGFFGHIARSGKVSMPVLKEAMAYGNIMGSYAIEDFSVNKLVAISPKLVQERFEKYKRMASF